MAERDFRQIIAPDWAAALEPVAGRIAAMGDFLRAEVAAGRRYLPPGELVLRAFQQPLGAVRVLIMGQDPYPTPGQAVGLSFSVPPTLRRLPPSLLNIFREYSDDLGYPRPTTGDLVPWSERGVLLLNRVLTVRPGQPGSHRGLGWEEVTDQAIRALAARPGPDGRPGAGATERGRARSAGAGTAERGGGESTARAPLVAILWGRDARSLAPLLDGVPLVESAHPSPNSADRGFFGSRPFSRANELLEGQGAAPVDWKLP
jgi:uracil-DNA glycosylase